MESHLDLVHRLLHTVKPSTVVDERKRFGEPMYAGERSSDFRQRKSQRIASQFRWSDLTLTCVLYGAENIETRCAYASKIADNIPKLLLAFSADDRHTERYESILEKLSDQASPDKCKTIAECYARDGCRIIIMYNETTPLEFLKEMKHYKPRVELHYFKQARPTPAIMFSRFLPFDNNPNGWVFTIDPQEDLKSIENYKSMIQLALKSGGGYQLAALYWTNGVNKMFPKRVPRRAVDAGAIGSFSGTNMPPIEPFIVHYMENFKYEYGLDEVLLEEWIAVRYPKWFAEETPGFLTMEGDPESDMNLSNIFKIDPTMVGESAQYFADKTIDFSKYVIGSAEHEQIQTWKDAVRYKR